MIQNEELDRLLNENMLHNARELRRIQLADENRPAWLYPAVFVIVPVLVAALTAALVVVLVRY